MSYNKTFHTEPDSPPYPPPYRFYLGSVGLGAACGIAWTLALTGPFAARHITKTHAIIVLYAAVAVLLLCQAWMLIRWDRRMKRDREQLNEQLEKIRRELGIKP